MNVSPIAEVFISEMDLVKNQYSAKLKIFIFPDASDKFSWSHVI